MKKLWVNALVTVLAVALFLGGCAPAGGDVLEVTKDTRFDTQQGMTSLPADVTENTADNEPADTTEAQTDEPNPDETVIDNSGFTGTWIDDTIGTAGKDAAQFRLTSVKDNWWMGFHDGSGNYFLVADSTDGLAAALRERNISVENLDLSAYDAAFFRENRLAVIPRTSNSGSVRYQYTLTDTADGVQIRVQGQMPEVGTADMADWLVLVPVPLADYDAGTVITVDPTGASFTGNTVDK